MHAVIAVPEVASMMSEQQTTELLMKKICGVPLLIRTAVTATRAGADNVLLVCPEGVTNKMLQSWMETARQYRVNLQVARLGHFDPQDVSSWSRLQPQLQEPFLWLPWNWVTSKQFLTGLLPVSMSSVDWSEPAFINLYEVDRGGVSLALIPHSPEGAAVTSPDVGGAGLSLPLVTVHSPACAAAHEVYRDDPTVSPTHYPEESGAVTSHKVGGAASGLHVMAMHSPVRAAVHEVHRDDPAFSPTPRNAKGIAVTSPESAAMAERFLVVHSGKKLDGIHTSFNRKLCRPFVRLLSHTPVTPNGVTYAGVAVSVLSAIAFAQGDYFQDVLGAFIFYIAGLFDEMDGMLARVKFAESPRGTWIEGFADGLSYLLLFGSITIGLRRQYGSAAIAMGVALLIGSVLALVATSLQRRRATAPDRPNEYLGRFYDLLEKDSGNWISRAVRHVQAFEKRGVMIIYIVLFALLGALPLLFCLATIGAHLTWILALYFNHRFFAAKPGTNTLREAL